VGLSWGGPPDNGPLPQGGNTAFGIGALRQNTTGGLNTAVGFDALESTTTGNANTATGTWALQDNTDGGENTANGVSALQHNTTGSFNTASGVATLLSNTTGSFNTASGAQALFFNTTGDENTAIGFSALVRNTTGGGNTASGAQALSANTTGEENTAVGFSALRDLTGSGNVAVGSGALENATTGSGNIAVGNHAGGGLRSGDHNIYLGFPVLGGPVDPASATESHTLRLGAIQGIVCSPFPPLTCGPGPGIARTFIAGIAGATVSNSTTVLINTSTGQVGTLSSSARYKRDIQPMGVHSRGLHQLRPVIFRYTQDVQGERQYGLIAEEVAHVYPELVTRGTHGAIEAVRYHEVIPMLLNEVQHQQRHLAELQAQNTRLRALTVQLHKRDEVHQAQHAALAARLERLEAAAARAATLASR
jgi:hypothetical protein